MQSVEVLTHQYEVRVTYTANDECLEEHQEEQQPAVWIGERLPSLIFTEDLLLDPLIVLADSLDELDFIFFRCPPSAGRGVG